jgi:acetyl esterase/lipase
MSLAMHAVALYLRLTAKPGSSTAARARDRMRKPKGTGQPPAALRRRHDVSVRQVSGFTCWTIRPRGETAARGAAYLHGGAYTSEITKQHWTLIGALADNGVQVEVPLYDLAPQHTYREAYPLVIEVYRQLLERLPAAAVTLAGDSAGAAPSASSARTARPTSPPPSATPAATTPGPYEPSASPDEPGQISITQWPWAPSGAGHRFTRPRMARAARPSKIGSENRDAISM